jgi:hypothetical protein
MTWRAGTWYDSYDRRTQEDGNSYLYANVRVSVISQLLAANTNFSSITHVTMR